MELDMTTDKGRLFQVINERHRKTMDRCLVVLHLTLFRLNWWAHVPLSLSN